ncbi:retrovirus-related pol polyprotein from transposon TNT 1-94 [Tanacetum coccineum]
MSDSQNSLRKFYKTDVILMLVSLSKTLKELQQELIKEVHKMLNIFESMEQKVAEKSPNENIFQSEIDRLLEVCLTREIRDCVLISVKEKKIELLKTEIEKSSSDSKYIQANLLKRIKILENDFKRSQAQSIDFELKLQHKKEKMACVESSNSVRRPKSKDTKSKNRVLKNTNVKSSSAHVRKVVKRALFTTPVAAKSKNLGATSVVAKSRLSIAKTPTTTNKVSSALSLSPDSSQSRTLNNYMKNKIATSRKWQNGLNTNNVLIGHPRAKLFNHYLVIQLVLWIVDSGCSKHMTGNLKLLRNFVEKFTGTVCFRNDHFATITGYGDYVQGNITICHILEGDDLLTGSRESNLYTISISELAAYSPAKLVPSIESKLKLLHMDLCGPMRVESINGKKYILVIVDDYSRYTWVYFLHSKDEAPDMIINFINQVQRNLNAQILKIRTDNGTEFKNKKLRSFYAKLGIVHHTSTARMPQQNGVVERRNRTLVEAVRTMLIIMLLLFLLQASESSCYHHVMNFARKPNVQYFYVFGSLCYPTNDHDDLGKMKPKADTGIFIGYSESSREEPITQESSTLVLETHSDEQIQEDVAELNGNTIMHSFDIPEFGEAESSLNYQDPSNMHEFHQQYCYTDKWTKNHPIEQVTRI